MNILSERKFNKPSAVIIGKFDGVHKGHQKLISVAREQCRNKGLSLVAYTFGGSALASEDKKLSLLEQYGVENVYLQPLESEFKKTSPEEFIHILKEDFFARCVAVGFNFRFGKDRCADAEDMKRLCGDEGISALVALPVTFKDEPISSTRIKNEISVGKVDIAREMLSRPYSFSAEVVGGKHLGRQIGFPTANLNISPNVLLPANGVYAGIATTRSGRYVAITNIGDNPTVDSDGRIKVETHLIDFNENIYGEQVTLEFLEYLRPEKKFASLSDLQNRLTADREKAKLIASLA